MAKDVKNILKYELNGPVCITRCPYIIGEIIPRIGSAMCSMCVCFVKKDRKKREVYCTFGKYSSPKFKPKKMYEEIAREYGYEEQS